MISNSPITIKSAITYALVDLVKCVKYVKLYGLHNSLVQQSIKEAHQSLVKLLIIQPLVVLEIADPYIVIDSFPIEDLSGNLQSIAEMMSARKIVEITLTAGITESEISLFAEVLSLTPEELDERNGIESEISKYNLTNIKVKEGEQAFELCENADPADIYDTAVILFEETMRAVRSGEAIPVTEIRSVVSDALYSIISDTSALPAMAGIQSYNRYLSEHSVNTCILSMVLGRDLGLDSATALELGIAAFLHDIGKAFIPEEIINKPGKLSEDEWLLIRNHPLEGANLLTGLSHLPALSATVALEHHVYGDGYGYPLFLSRYDTHLLSRLVAIVDSYDALTTERPFRKRWTPQQAIACMLYESPNRYDSQLLAKFAAKVNLRPVGALVRLMNGETAVITGGSHEHPHQPVIRLLTGMNKGDTVDLSTTTDLSFEIESVAEPLEALLPYTEKLIR